MQRHEPPQRHGLAVRRVEVHRRGHDGDVARLHRRREGSRPAADVDPEADDGLRGLRDLEELRDREVELGFVGGELRFGPLGGEIEACAGELGRQAIEGLAGVARPDDGGFGVRVCGLRRAGEAAAARERVAAAEDEFLDEIGVGGAEGVRSVVHVLVEEVGVVVASGGYGGEFGVEEEIFRGS